MATATGSVTSLLTVIIEGHGAAPGGMTLAHAAPERVTILDAAGQLPPQKGPGREMGR